MSENNFNRSSAWMNFLLILSGYFALALALHWHATGNLFP